jgi:prolyl oligopeptidase
MAPGCVVQAETWTTSARWLACSAAEGCRDSGLLAPSTTSFADILVERTTARSADGTDIPLTILHPASTKLDGTNPTLLDGYGAYGIPRMPSFQPARRAWFDAGGVLAFAHVRGGGEFGEAWHAAGTKKNKIHSIEDFIACGEKLIELGFTSKEHLAAAGGSAGGIVVTGAILKRPDLFRAAEVTAGFANMVRLEQAGSGAHNAAEFGSIKTQEGFESLYAMDAFHHVVPGTPYPAMLFTAGMNDPRVPPWHPAKLVARLQKATTSGRRVLLRVSFEGGHGDSTRADYVTERTDTFSFLLSELGHPAFAQKGRP